MLLGPVSLLDCLVFVTLLAPQLLIQAGVLPTLRAVIWSLPFLCKSLRQIWNQNAAKLGKINLSASSLGLALSHYQEQTQILLQRKARGLGPVRLSNPPHPQRAIRLQDSTTKRGARILRKGGGFALSLLPSSTPWPPMAFNRVS